MLNPLAGRQARFSEGVLWTASFNKIMRFRNKFGMKEK